MDLRYLRSFVAVAEERHFARAADRLHVAQPWLSQQIRRIESELGVVLFERTTRRVELTSAGETLLPRAREILSSVDAAVADVRRADAGELGRLTISFTGSATYALLPAVAAALRRALPRLELNLRGEQLTPAQVAGLLDGTIDIGILRPPVRGRGLSVEVVRQEPLLVALPSGHRLARKDCIRLEQLKHEQFVSYVSEFRSVLRDAVELACESHGFVPNVALEAAETTTVVSFVAAGIGVALLPASASHMQVRGAVYRALADDTPTVDLALAWRSDDQRHMTTRALALARTAIAGHTRDCQDRDEPRLDSGDGLS